MRVFLKTISLFLFITASNSAHSQSKDTLSFCYTTWLPYTVLSKDNELSGISIELIRKAAQNLDIEVAFIKLPWKRCLHDVRLGKLDAVVDAGARDDLLQGPTALAYYSNAIWVHQVDALKDLSDLTALSGRVAGYIDGYTYAEPYWKIPDLTIDYSPNEATVLKKLAARRVDFIIADYINTKHVLKKQLLPIRALKPFPSVDPLFLSFNRDRKAAHLRFEAEFRSLRTSGFVDQVYLKHTGTSLKDITQMFAKTVLDDLEQGF